MLWAPLSEFPNVGRLYVYWFTLLVFFALQFPTIYANNIHTLLSMRFLAGWFGGPALAIGGATMGDVSSSLSLFSLSAIHNSTSYGF